MGYTTEFNGAFELDKPLSSKQLDYLRAFSCTRHMTRNVDKTTLREDPVRVAVGLPVGISGGYFVGDISCPNNVAVSDVVSYNNPPAGQPGLWCHWIPDDIGESIVWNGAEKFYDYVEWLNYLIDHFLKPWVINCLVKFFGLVKTLLTKVRSRSKTTKLLFMTPR